VLTPFSAEFPSSNFPELRLVNRRPVLAFDAAADEACQWTDIAPQGLTGTLELIVSCIAASATSGAVGLQATIEAVTALDAVDLDASDSFDSANNSASTTVPATAGHLFQITITLTNKDSIAPGDYFRVKLNRDADGSAITDDATGDLYALGAEIRDAA
jgi:hypothetical protein